MAQTICTWSFLAAFALRVDPAFLTNPAPSHSGHVSLREKKIGKAVPIRATATAPAIRYVVPSAETSPTAATTVSCFLPLTFSIVPGEVGSFEPKNTVFVLPGLRGFELELAGKTAAFAWATLMDAISDLFEFVNVNWTRFLTRIL